MNKIEAANQIAAAINEGVKKTFLGFDEETLRLISPEEFFAHAYENEDGAFVSVAQTALNEEEVIYFDGFVPAGFGVEAYTASILEVYKS